MTELTETEQLAVAKWRLNMLRKELDKYVRLAYSPDASDRQRTDFAAYTLGVLSGMFRIPDVEAHEKMVSDPLSADKFDAMWESCG